MAKQLSHEEKKERAGEITGEICFKIDKARHRIKVQDREDAVYLIVPTFGYMGSYEAIYSDLKDMGLGETEADRWANILAEDIRKRAIIETLLT